MGSNIFDFSEDFTELYQILGFKKMIPRGIIPIIKSVSTFQLNM